ncbi:MAG: hypothetical protein IT158_18150 [Bryobacterales bacterium]|nr:hypothetical protein [Bryobacterales bacterium]
MKRYITLLAAVAAILTAAAPAFAQTPAYKAEVPFQFVAGDRAMPAGEYRIVVIPWTNRIEMYAEDGAATLFLPGTTAGGTGHPGKLTFARYGERVFLRGVEVGGRNVHLPKTRSEREIGQGPASTELALVRARAR